MGQAGLGRFESLELRPQVGVKLRWIEAGVGVVVAMGRVIALTDGTVCFEWHVTSLRELWRGDAPAPMGMKTPPDKYLPFLYAIEANLGLFAAVKQRAPYDDEMLEIYSALRRRPDGKSLSSLHDHIWQAVALALGLYPTSEDEYGALMARLAQSVRRWRSHETSSGYYDFLAKTSARTSEA